MWVAESLPLTTDCIITAGNHTDNCNIKKWMDDFLINKTMDSFLELYKCNDKLIVVGFDYVSASKHNCFFWLKHVQQCKVRKCWVRLSIDRGDSDMPRQTQKVP